METLERERMQTILASGSTHVDWLYNTMSSIFMQCDILICGNFLVILLTLFNKSNVDQLFSDNVAIFDVAKGTLRFVVTTPPKQSPFVLNGSYKFKTFLHVLLECSSDAISFHRKFFYHGLWNDTTGAFSIRKEDVITTGRSPDLYSLNTFLDKAWIIC